MKNNSSSVLMMNQDKLPIGANPVKKVRNLNSPRTIQAIKNLGFKPADLILKKYDEFILTLQDDDEADKEILKLRHQRFLKRVGKRWKMVGLERKRIKTEDKRLIARQSIQIRRDDLPPNLTDLRAPNLRNETISISKSPNKTLDYYSNPLNKFNGKSNSDLTLQVNSKEAQKMHTYQQSIFFTQSSCLDQVKAPISAKNLTNDESEKKIFQKLDMKIEKIKQDEERRKKILEKLQRKFDNSEYQRNQFLVEEVQAKAKKNHLLKLQQIKSHQQSMEDKQSFEYLREMQLFREREQNKKDYENELRKEQLYRQQEELRKQEMLQKEKQINDLNEHNHSQLALFNIEKKQQRSRQKFQEILNMKSEYLQLKNHELLGKYAFVQDRAVEQEREKAERFLENAKKRNNAYISRQQVFQQFNNSQLSQSQDLEFRRNKYSILNKSVADDPYRYDEQLMRQIEEKFKKASERKGETDKQRERQVQLKRELEKLKQEEIMELKMMQGNQNQAIRHYILGKQWEKDMQIKMMKDTQEFKAQNAQYKQVKINREKQLRLRQSLNIQ